tara:strand:- start:50 stop:982 length:933 start_codon:yes stop_codon:yes gene_type:complete
MWAELLELLWELQEKDKDSIRHLEKNADVLVPLFVKLQKAFILFTGGNVVSVKDPSKFNPNEVKHSFRDIWDDINYKTIFPIVLTTLRSHRKYIRHAFVNYPTQLDYQNAHKILMELSAADLSRTLSFHRPTENPRLPIDSRPDTVFRMIHLNWKEAMDLLNPRTTHGDFGRPVSTSYERRVTYGFTSSNPTRVNLLFIIKHKNKGVYISRFSVYDDEKEIISGGKYKINDIEVTYIDSGEIDSGTGVDRQTAFDTFMKVYFTGVDATKLDRAKLLILAKERNDLLFPSIATEQNLYRYPMCFIVECELI